MQTSLHYRIESSFQAPVNLTICKQRSDGDDMQLMKGKERLEEARDENELPAGHLKLKLTRSFLTLIGLMLAWHNDVAAHSNINLKCKYEELKIAQNQHKWKKNRRKPTRLPAWTLHIGNKKFTRTDERKVFAKFCYGTKTIVCQMCMDKLCRKVDIPLADITSLSVHFGRRSDILKIEAKSLLKPFRAAKPLPGKLHKWKVDRSKEDDDYFPESKSFCLEIEKGMLEKSYAKLLYTDPRLLRVLRFARGAIFQDQHIDQTMNAYTQQTHTFAPLASPSDAVFPYIGGAVQNTLMNSSYTGLDWFGRIQTVYRT